MYYIGVDLGTSAVKLLLMEETAKLQILYQKNIRYIFHIRAGVNRSLRTGGKLLSVV